jgi:glycosyltransferase involved in cell wall biosynthesis
MSTTARVDSLRYAALTPLVSVLLSSRNGARYLDESLASLAAQTYPELEIVAVDDGSTDETPAILGRFAERHGRTRVLRTKGIGLAGALHLAAGEAKGTLLARQDDDDRSDPERIERQVRFLHRNPDVGLVGTAAVRIDATGATVGTYDVPLDADSIAAALRRGTPFVHGSVVLRREAYEAAGGYRAPFLAAQDVDLWLRVPNEHHFANLPETLYAWREHPGGVFARARDSQLFFAATARAFAEERRANRAGAIPGVDSVALLAESESPTRFLERYARADRVAVKLGELLVREGRTDDARPMLRRAARSARSAPEAILWLALSYPVAWSPRGRRGRAR